MLLEVAHKQYPGARLAAELEAKVDAAYGPATADAKVIPRPTRRPWPTSPPGPARSSGVETTVDELAAMRKADARNRLVDALDAKHRPEMREMEKALLLQILDSSWMEHLRAMDHLRSSVGLRGYAQVDPKVEYKREGMKTFEEMWLGVSDKVTDLIFRMEQVDPDFLSYLGARWQLDRARTIHEAPRTDRPRCRPLAAPPAPASVRSQQEAAIAASQKGEHKAEPLRNSARRSAGTTPARAVRVKNSRPAACGNRPNADLF